MFPWSDPELKLYKSLSAAALGITAIRESEKVELALTYGFAGMDFDVVEFKERVAVHGLEHSRRLIDSAQIRLSSFDPGLDFEAADDAFAAQVAKLEASARQSAEVGCNRCQTLITPANDERPFNESFERYRARLTQVAQVLEPLEVRLGLGFQAAAVLRKEKAFEFIYNLESLLVLVNTVASANVGVAIDTWDLFVAGEKVDDLRKLQPEQVVTVAVADISADQGTGDSRDDCTAESRRLPGSVGRIDASEALSVLAEMGYEGPVTATPDRSQFQGMTRDAIVRATGEAMINLWSAAGLPPHGNTMFLNPVEDSRYGRPQESTRDATPPKAEAEPAAAAETNSAPST